MSESSPELSPQDRPQPDLAPTPGQTVGPFFGYALPFETGPTLVSEDYPGARVLHGRVLDGAGDPVPDALLEVWLTLPEDPEGEHAALVRSPAGFGRAETDPQGHYWFRTPAPQGAHFSLVVLARGLIDRLFTRAYLPEHPGLADDPLLAGLPPERRATLVAEADEQGWVFDVRLQGEAETVFLRYPRH